MRKLSHSALWRMAARVRHGTTTGIDLICQISRPCTADRRPGRAGETAEDSGRECSVRCSVAVQCHFGLTANTRFNKL
jgi:hypothetical protein